MINQTVQKITEDQFNNQQLVLAKQSALSIKYALDSVERDLIILSKLYNVQKIEQSDGLREMNVMYYIYLKENGVIDIARFDANNTLQYSVPKENHGKYTYPIISLNEVKRTGKPYISEVINYHSKDNKKGIIITVPVYDPQTGEFLGVISAIIDLDLLIDKYLTQIKSGKSGYAMLIDNKGNVLYAGENTELVGINYYDILNNPEASAKKIIPLLQKQLSGESGTGFCYWQCHGERNSPTLRYLVAYAPINFRNIVWSVAVTAPADEAKEILHKTFILTIIFITAIVLIIIGGSSVIIRMHSCWNKDLEKEVKEKTKKITKERKKFEAILKGIGDGVIIKDKDKNILFANEVEKRRYGEDIVGKKCFEAHANKKDPCDKCPEVDKVFENGNITTNIRKLLDKYGYLKYYEVTTSPLRDEKGNITAAIEIIRDITKRKQLELQLKDSYEKIEIAYNKLKELDKLKSNFINVVAHELRTPLAVIKGFIDILALDKEKNLTDKQKEHLKVMDKNVNQLNKLINDMLYLSHADSGKLELHIETLNIANIVNSVIDNFIQSIKEKKQSITINIPDSLIIEGDEQKINQIFSNLISNAVKYTPEGGKIYINIEERDKDIIVKVKDTGIGIPEKDLSKVFEKFYLVDADSLTREVDRIGLGLSIVKNNVKLHGGNIWVESKLGEGSTFGFTLPKKGVRG
ncbi:MAG: ATP-binding protein [Methanosarcinales archaeon]